MPGSWWCFCVVKNQIEGVSIYNEVFFINEWFAYQEIQEFLCTLFLQTWESLIIWSGLKAWICLEISHLFPPPPSFSKVGTQTLLAYYCRSGIIFYLPMANTWVIKKINNSNQSTFWCLASAISETLYNKRRIHTAKYEILKTVVIQLPKRKVQNKCLAWVRSRDLNLDPPGWWQTSCSLLLWVKQKKTPYESEHSYPKQLHRLT